MLEDFGIFIVPSLMKTLGHLLQPQWKTMDVIEHTERAVHAVVRVKDAGAKPPELRTLRRSEDEVTLVYTSPQDVLPGNRYCEGFRETFWREHHRYREQLYAQGSTEL